MAREENAQQSQLVIIHLQWADTLQSCVQYVRRLNSLTANSLLQVDAFQSNAYRETPSLQLLILSTNAQLGIDNFIRQVLNTGFTAMVNTAKPVITCPCNHYNIASIQLYKLCFNNRQSSLIFSINSHFIVIRIIYNLPAWSKLEDCNHSDLFNHTHIYML